MNLSWRVFGEAAGNLEKIREMQTKIEGAFE